MSSEGILKNEIFKAILSRPIVYINHYHYLYIDEVLKEAIGGIPKCECTNIMEYDQGQGAVVDFDSKTKVAEYSKYHYTHEIIQEMLSPSNGSEASPLIEKKHLFLFKDPDFLNPQNPTSSRNIALLNTFALKYEKGIYDKSTTVIIVSPQYVINIPNSLKNLLTVINVTPPTTAEIKEYIETLKRSGAISGATSQGIDDMVRTLQGMQMYDVKQALRTALELKNGRIERGSVRIALDEKKRIVRKSGIIEVVDTDVCFEDVGGLQRLRNDLEVKSNIYHNLGEAEKYRVPVPKGVLIIGMPGCGKSMIAQATANLFGVSLLRLDVSRLMGKYVGESEANLRLALATAEAAHPCVLWIDEIEKAFAGSNRQGGENDMLVMRMMGHFLTWMQERKTPVFIIATANDVMRPEFMRKGRFDEVYFVNFPNEQERADILSKKIKKKYERSELFDFSEIGDCKEVVKNMTGKYGGFSGSEIECVLNIVVEEKFSTFLQNKDTEKPLKIKITKKDFEEAIKKIKESVMANQQSKQRKQDEFLQDKTSIERIIDMKETYRFTDAS